MRIGHGFDVHAFGEGDGVVLGGVRIPFHRALVAHSDGDVLLHAVCDGLLGAAALGDIGRHFPDTSARFADADSRQLLRAVRSMLEREGWRTVNIDATVICQLPRLAPHIAQMRAHLGADLAIDVSQVSVKATTTEKLGYLGRGEGIAAHAVVLIERSVGTPADG